MYGLPLDHDGPLTDWDELRQYMQRIAESDVDATLREVDGHLEIEASAVADQRELGMTWSPLGLIGAPSKLIVRGRLTPAR
jgi:hypothetical protein